MTDLSKYVLREHLGPFFFALALILFILLTDVVLQMMDQVLSKGLHWTVAARLLLYNLAWIVALAVPMAVLVAVIMAFGRLAADCEIMAAKACGIGFFRILRPALITAIFLDVLMILFNDLVLPDFNHRARNIYSNLRRQKAALVLKEKEGVFIHDLGKGQYSLLVQEVDEQRNRLLDITIYDASQPGPPLTLHAPAGSLRVFNNGEYIQITLLDGEFHRVDASHPERFTRGAFARQVIHIKDPRRALSDYRSSWRSDREMNVAAMRAKVRGHHEKRQRLEALMDSSVSHFINRLNAVGVDEHQEQPKIYRRQTASPTADFDSLLTIEVEALKKKLANQQHQVERHIEDIDRYSVEIHKKFSIPSACIVFVLLGAPLGARVRRSGAAVSVAVSLGFFWIYWMFLIGGEELADRGFILPAVAMWAPNLTFGLLGGYLTWITAMDRPLLGRRRRNEVRS